MGAFLMIISKDSTPIPPFHHNKHDRKRAFKVTPDKWSRDIWDHKKLIMKSNQGLLSNSKFFMDVLYSLRQFFHISKTKCL